MLAAALRAGRACARVEKVCAWCAGAKNAHGMVGEGRA